MHIINSQASNRDAIGRCATWRAILIVLLDHNTVLRNVGERDVLVRDSRNGTSSAVDGLDSYAVVTILDR